MRLHGCTLPFHIPLHREALAILLGSLPLAACGDVTVPEDAVAVQFAVITPLGGRGFQERDRTIIRDAAHFQAVWDQLVAFQTPASSPPSIDFGNNTIIAASMGMQGGGAWIAIEGVFEKKGELFVVVVEGSAGRDCLTPAVITWPVTVVEIPREGSDFAFVERTRVVDCPVR